MEPDIQIKEIMFQNVAQLLKYIYKYIRDFRSKDIKLLTLDKKNRVLHVHWIINKNDCVVNVTPGSYQHHCVDISPTTGTRWHNLHETIPEGQITSLTTTEFCRLFMNE